jgi:hypothetical protein
VRDSEWDPEYQIYSITLDGDRRATGGVGLLVVGVSKHDSVEGARRMWENVHTKPGSGYWPVPAPVVGDESFAAMTVREEAPGQVTKVLVRSRVGNVVVQATVTGDPSVITPETAARYVRLMADRVRLALS